jgi:hypothetical protein
MSAFEGPPMAEAAVIDSESVGNPDLFRTLADLERRLEALPAGPDDVRRVALIVGVGTCRAVFDDVR